MIFNGILAWKFLNEKLKVYKIVTILVIALGAVIAISFASYESTIYNSAEQYELIFSRRSIIFIYTCSVVFLTGFIISHYIVVKIEAEIHLETHSDEIDPASLNAHKLMYIPRAFLPCLPGFMSGLTCLLIKCNSMAVITASTAHNFDYWLTYAFFFFWITSSMTQNLFMNYAFHHFPQLEVVPLYLSASLLSNIIVGGICFDEFS
jgi:hypothetical protein